MAIQIDYIKKGISLEGTYHTISYLKDKKNKTCIITMLIFSNKLFADQNPQEFFDTERIEMHPDDFELYMNKPSKVEEKYQNEADLYEFIKTVDPTAIDSKYADCRFNYKKDSIDIIEIDIIEGVKNV